MKRSDSDHVGMIGRFFKGQTSDEENHDLNNLSREDFEEACSKVWGETASSELGEKTYLSMRTDIQNRIRKYEEEQASIRRRKWRKVWNASWKTMAVAAMVAFAVFFGYQWSINQSSKQEFELVCANGQQSLLTLPDGTTVHLNSSSKLAYNSSFNSRDREIRLEGEAYFDVAHNEDKPFIVKAGEMEVKVLGTQFNVKAYAGDDEIEATLVKGKILAQIHGEEEILLPNERLHYDCNSGKVSKTSNIEQNNLVPWIENKIYFEHNTLAEIAVMLERMYDVQIVFSDKRIENFSYTGHIRNISLKNILELISSTSPIEFKVEGNIITLSLLNEC